MQVSDLRLMIMDAGTAQYANYKELGRWSGAVDAVTALLARLHAVWSAAQQLDSAGTLAGLFASQALNRLMGMLAVVYCRRVTLEGASAAKRRTRQWRELCEAVGLLERHVAVALSPASKALMLMLYAAASGGEKRLNIRVSRRMAFWDAHAEAVMHGVLASSRERACYKIFPSFVQSADNNRGNGAAEHGEGHGPRKEFFLLAAASAAGVPLSPAADDSTGDAQCTLPPNTKPLLVYNRAAGAYWLNQTLPQSDEAATRCRFLGWLMGQAVCNHCTLGVSLPPLLFELLLHGPDKYRPSLAALRGFDPQMARAIDNTRQLPDSDFQVCLHPTAHTAVMPVRQSLTTLCCGHRLAYPYARLQPYPCGPLPSIHLYGLNSCVTNAKRVHLLWPHCPDVPPLATAAPRDCPLPRSRCWSWRAWRRPRRASGMCSRRWTTRCVGQCFGSCARCMWGSSSHWIPHCWKGGP
jgi:hypothetical protein